jgi:hypothetical protein
VSEDAQESAVEKVQTHRIQAEERDVKKNIESGISKLDSQDESKSYLKTVVISHSKSKKKSKPFNRYVYAEILPPKLNEDNLQIYKGLMSQTSSNMDIGVAVRQS